MTRQMHCNICGGPFLGSDRTWLGEATLMSTGHQTQNGIEIDEYYPRHHTVIGFRLGEYAPEQTNRILLRLDSKYGPDTRTFYLLERKETVRPNALNKPASRPGGGSLYLPVHKACLQLADHFIYTASILETAVAETTSDRITSELQLWEVLCRRLDQAETDTLPKEPHHFYVPHTILTPMPWEREPDPDDDSEEYVWAHTLLMANPLDISNVTQYILKNLKAIPDTKPPSHAKQDESFELLVKPKAFPWLWDLDTGYIRDKQLSGHWDWEYLIRLPSEFDIHMHGNDSLHIPASLRNRRRTGGSLKQPELLTLQSSAYQAEVGTEVGAAEVGTEAGIEYLYHLGR